MNIHNVIINKVLQFALSIVRRFLKTPHQLTFSGQGSAEQLTAHIVRTGSRKILLVTDKPLVELGLAGRVVQAIETMGATAVVYDGVLPDPTVAVVQGALDNAAIECGNIQRMAAMGTMTFNQVELSVALQQQQGKVIDLE